MVKKQRIKESPGDRVFGIINGVILLLCFLTVAYPLWYVIIASFSSPQAISQGKVWLLPAEPTLMAYQEILHSDSILRGYLNSIIYTVTGTAVSLILTILAAYPLSRKKMFGRKAIMFLFTFTMFFSGGLIPTYLVVKNLGMLNTIWAIIIPSALSVYNMIVTKTYFQSTIPEEMYEAAQIDGCNHFRMLISIVVPLSKPILAVMTLYYGVGKWNSYFDALIYLSKQEMMPLQMILRSILVAASPEHLKLMDPSQIVRTQGLFELLRYAVIIVAVIPPLILYPFVQKHFVKDLLIKVK